jgi:hypothetical protein
MAITRIGNPAIANQRGVNFRNIIINGGMDLAQRGTSASGLTTTTTYNTADRWRLAASSAGTWTQSQSTDVPTGQGFAKSLKMDCTTADASLASGDYLLIQQLIEGQNLQYLKKGTSSAESTTISFWVKSNKTGTYITELLDTDNSRQISKSYTINSANTWEKKTITYVGDTTGAFNNDNALSLEVNFWLGAGSTYTSGTLATSWESQTSANRAVGQVNLADSTSNEWYITGVQLETGQVASDFEFLPHDVNLARCYRYYYLYVSGQSKQIANAMAYNSGLVNSVVQLPITMRTTPSLDMVTGTNYYQAYGNNTGDSVNGFTLLESSPNIAGLRNTTEFSGVQGYAYFIYTANSASEIAFSAEL